MAEATTPYQMLGADGIQNLAQTFYTVMDEMPQAKIIRAMHADNTDAIVAKLTEFLTGWMGGPPIYAEKHGTVCLTDPHEAYHIGPQERDQWLVCMDEALLRIEASDELKEMLKIPMFRLADTVRNQDSSERKPKDPNIIASS